MFKHVVVENNSSCRVIFPKKYSSEEKSEIQYEAVKYISSTNLALSHFEKDGAREWTKFICSQAAISASDAKVFTPSHTVINKHLNLIESETKNFIRDHGKQLAQDGRLMLAIDHWQCSRGSSEKENTFLGVLLCSRREKDQSLVTMPLCFQTTKKKRHTEVREELLEILKVSSFLFLNLW